ncbi:MAG: hypothetical protein RLZZ243_1180 [Bacteroidota bacterium]|jgi:hypothetical protein
MRKIWQSKWFRYPFWTLVFSFAAIGFFLSASFVAIKFRLTDEKGSVDANNRYFEGMEDKYNQAYKLNSEQLKALHFESLDRILLLKKYYPKNAQYILDAWKASNNEVEVKRMIDAVDIQLKSNRAYQQQLRQLKRKKQKKDSRNTLSAFEWMNIQEWSDFKIAVAKDVKLVDSVAQQTGVEGRLIVSCLVGEQIRLFNSDREAYKKWISPLKILSVESMFSFGVTGIKEHTAIQIEEHLKNPKSVYYLGEKYEHLLDFKTANPTQERISRLTDFHNHYYSYLYAAIFVKQVKMQWERAGFPIDHRPEILVTLFNVGYPQSIPKAHPKVGGSTIKIKEKAYTFGAVAYQFYYSGELFDLFPFEKRKFDWNEIALR